MVTDSEQANSTNASVGVVFVEIKARELTRTGRSFTTATAISAQPTRTACKLYPARLSSVAAASAVNCSDSFGQLESQMWINTDDIEVRGHPDPAERKGGMGVGKISNGVRAIHKPTGNEAVCISYRSQHHNRDAALLALEIMINDGTRPNR